jgi:actin-related protein
MKEMDEEVTAVCIDNGSGTIKAGFAGDEAPKSVFRTVVGRPDKSAKSQPPGDKEFYIGRDCLQKAATSTLSIT